ncbi:MAG: type II toxin-antitoxin system RelB/DinJ family antitoxin [Coriobacteriales bacterium]|jgi:DNA-damage-inducible protein J|nr:type II toxin-antitoxin system RelB/DinJ family antitoxin [Coriobacteriales bacterium]
MVTTKLVAFRIDEQVKDDFDKFCHQAGLSVSSAYNLFARTVVREQRIPFEISMDPFYSSENMSVLQKSIKDAEDGTFGATAKVDDFDELMANL